MAMKAVMSLVDWDEGGAHMGKNREAELLKEAFGGIPTMGKIFYVIFSMTTVVAAATLFFYPFAWAEIVAGSSAPGLEVIYGILDRLSMLCPCVCCMLLAKDVSEGGSPFAGKQIKRMVIASAVLVVYALACFLWGPIAALLPNGPGPYALHFSEYFVRPDLSRALWLLVAALGMGLFAMVLRYGATLQMLADETA